MPNFNTHWLVAMKCIKDSGLPASIVEGFTKYKKVTQDFRTNLETEIHKVVNKEAYNAFLKKELDKALIKYNKNLTDEKNYDDITYFSAYMLGACGPDFWTVPSPAAYKNPLPDTAGVHFDLGHYNRSHRQFQVAIKRWKSMDSDSIQVKAEQAYFYGMATHIATDCVVHQLVNVSAGAYNQLVKDNWENEQGKLFKNLWNTHNKVEHYWDSYIRYRYLGDTKALFPGKPGLPNLDEANWMTVLNFPTTETIIADLTNKIAAGKADQNNNKYDKNKFKLCLDKIAVQERLIKELQKDENKIKIEKPFILPRIFCDRVNASNNPIAPFLHDIVVNKDTGAYPGKINDKNVLEGVIFKAAIEEAKHFQMEAGKDPQTKKMTYSEAKKLSYFASKENEGTSGTSFNYLNYYVCPNLDKVKLYGWDVFYHSNALGPFTDSAMKAGKKFIDCLNAGIKTKDPDKIGLLGKFWNLDTGLGLEVRLLPSDTPHEVITELNFIHINKDVTTQVNYTKNENYLKTINATPKPYPDTAEISAFDTGSESETAYFNHITSVEEADKNKYTDMLLLKPRVPSPDPASKIDSFFMNRKETKTKPMVAKTESQTPTNVIRAHDIKHRLNLLMTVPIADVSPRGKFDELGFELRCDGDKAIKEMKPATDTETKKWLKTSKAIVRIKAQDKDKFKPGRFARTDTGMCVFNTRLFLNLEKNKELKREVKKGIWNNVIEYNNHDVQYSRNYSVGTSRKNVLFPVSKGNFNGKTDFAKYIDISPTEQVFFSIYLLTRTNNEWYDMLSKETVSKDQLEKLIRIDALGFVKIVMFYELTKNGGSKLAECYVDGLRVPVIPGKASLGKTKKQ